MALQFDPVKNAEDRAHVLNTLDQSRKDSGFLDAHRKEWLEAYADSWVLVYKEQLVGNPKTLAEASRIAEQIGVPLSHMAREYLSSQPIAMILGTLGCRG